ncbi:MAG TPA: non-homologous end-joining DNA ligase [Pseudonocardiaceae bacterium]
MSGLSEYRRKRDAARTPEPVPPPGDSGEDDLPRGNDDTFVIQEHHARRLHWDVRLERDGVLVSWAVPRGLPEAPGDIRLAVHTEDHPMEYATFEGVIPKGEYGAGKMMIWDRGRYETVKWSDREVAVVLHGQRVSGRYVFFRSSRNVEDRDWMVRRSDPPTDPDWQPLPDALAPMLATPGSLPAPEDDANWAYEFKWDGVRALARVEGGRVLLTARSGHDITVTYPELRALGAELGSSQVLLDGEIVALRDGRPSFAALQSRMHVANAAQARRLADQLPITYLIFDVLHLNGRPTLALPYADRRSLLESLELDGPRWQTTPSFTGDGAVILEAATEQRLEGLVAKRLTSRYHTGRRSPDWIKITTDKVVEVVIGGWRPGGGRREGLVGSLMLGVPSPDGGGLRYVGQVGTGFSDEALRAITARLQGLARPASPFVTPVPPDRARGATWVDPVLVGEVIFREWTPDGRMRLPSWRGLRPDKTPADVTPP